MKRVLALLGFGTLAACLQISGDQEGGTTGTAIYSTDAYGLPPFRDAGPQDIRDGGKPD